MKIETKIYRAPECQVFQVALNIPILAESDLSTTESITIDDEEYEW